MFVDIDHMNVHIDDFHTFRTSLEILDNTGYCSMMWDVTGLIIPTSGNLPQPQI